MYQNIVINEPYFEIRKQLVQINDWSIANFQRNEAKKQWYAPDTNPLSRNLPDVNDYIKSNTWIYYYNPIIQYDNLLGVDNYKSYICIECDNDQTLESNGWHWRPMIDFDRTIMVLHQRLRCAGTCGCGKTFATISPQFMN